MRVTENRKNLNFEEKIEDVKYIPDDNLRKRVKTWADLAKVDLDNVNSCYSYLF